MTDSLDLHVKMLELIIKLYTVLVTGPRDQHKADLMGCSSSIRAITRNRTVHYNMAVSKAFASMVLLLM